MLNSYICKKQIHMSKIEKISFSLYYSRRGDFTTLECCMNEAELRSYLLSNSLCQPIDLSPLDDFIQKANESDSQKRIECHILYHNGKIYVAPNISYFNSLERKLQSMEKEALSVKYVIKDVVQYSFNLDDNVVSYRVSHENQGKYTIYVYEDKVVTKFKTKDEVRDVLKFGTKPFFVIESYDSRMGSAG